jgi:tetratricopeptide (TPR) repeat protein
MDRSMEGVRTRAFRPNALKLKICFCLVIFALGAFAQNPTKNGDLPKAEELYKRTQYEASLALLDQRASDPATLFLIGRNLFMTGDFKRSAEFLQKASAAQPTNSEYMDWIGRVYGKKAETGNPLTAPSNASKARQAFERAVELDPHNSDALADLFDYYLEAPGFLGGGYGKAMAVAEKIAVFDPPEGYFCKAKLAQKRKEYQEAEDHLKRAIAVAPREVSHVIELAKLLATEGRTKESDAVFAQAQKVDPNAPSLWFARADVLIRQKRNLDEAKTLLKKYVHASSLTVDDPPREEALRLLKHVGS